MGIGRDFSKLTEEISYSFNELSYLETALTHSSYSNEMRTKGIKVKSNETLEFLGDAVLQIVISEYLFQRFSKQGEGILTQMRQSIVCEGTLARIARRLDLGIYLNVGTGEESTSIRTNDKVLADALEALIGAVYLDDKSNNDAALYSSVIISLLKEEIESVLKKGNRDYKTMLQTFVEQNGDSLLDYKIEESGPAHAREFYAVAYINNNKVGYGKGKTKRSAEMQAAKMALALFGII